MRINNAAETKILVQLRKTNHEFANVRVYRKPAPFPVYAETSYTVAAVTTEEIFFHYVRD